MTTWICANCGAEHDSNEPPCRQCAGEVFAKVVDEPQTVEDRASVEWRCESCATKHIKNNPPCDNCGHMKYTAVDKGKPDKFEQQSSSNTGASDADEQELKQPKQRALTATVIIAYLFGVSSLWFAFSSIDDSVIASAGFLLAGLVATPSSKRRIESATGYQFTTGATTLIFILAWLIGLVAFNAA